MKVLFMMNTPADVHTWKNLIYALMQDGNQVRILARDYRGTLELLDKYEFEYTSFKPIRSKYLKIFEILIHVWKGHQLSQKFNPTIIVGFGVDAALTSALFRKSCIVFTDSEPVPVQNFLTKLFATVILTPSCYRKDFGKKQVRFAGYKELAYLHPNYFQPDLSIYDELGISTIEKYAVLRFNVFDAFHDIGKRGFSLPDKYRLVRELEKYNRVFISAEGSLPKSLKSFKLPTAFHRIHHVLYYAQLLIADTGTMITEAAVLGTPSILCGSSVGQFGNFTELEQRYDMIHCFREPEQAIQKAVELIQQPDLKEQWAKKRQRLLADKIDVTQFMVDFIEDFAKGDI
ncbi:MAG: hypothetical protein DDT31_01504 [Syntrophomonadaceae bacterium]|nr:hypothetical protein [Bacillota bacterium]